MPARDPFERLVDEIGRGGSSRQSVWGQHQRRMSSGPRERRIGKALREYWGADADPMRVRFAQEDARFVAGVARMVGDELGLSSDDRRRVISAIVRHRLLAEPDPSLQDVDRAWMAWWPPQTGEDARARMRDFLRAWREWLADSSS